jgi:hypothetical protein
MSVDNRYDGRKPEPPYDPPVMPESCDEHHALVCEECAYQRGVTDTEARYKRLVKDAENVITAWDARSITAHEIFDLRASLRALEGEKHD